jgi:hypothetical protein
MAQMGRLASLPDPSGGHSLWSATSCLGTCTNDHIEWWPTSRVSRVSGIAVAPERDPVRASLANASLPHAVESKASG